MNIIDQYEKLLGLTTQIGGLLQGNADALAVDDLLAIIQQRQDLMRQISEYQAKLPGSNLAEEVTVEQIIRKIQNIDKTNYIAMEKFKQECLVKLNEMRQNNDAFDAYNPVSSEASAFFVDKKR